MISFLSLKLRSILLLTMRHISSSGAFEWNCLTLRIILLFLARAFILSTFDSFPSREPMLPAIFFVDFLGVFYDYFYFSMEQVTLLGLHRIFLMDFSLSEIFFLDFCLSSCEKMLVVFF